MYIKIVLAFRGMTDVLNKWEETARKGEDETKHLFVLKILTVM